jgi:transcriptional regulator with XRE-family HTH domain
MTPDELRAIRAALGWTKQHMADVTGRSARQWRDYEGGRAKIPAWVEREAKRLAAGNGAA